MSPKRDISRLVQYDRAMLRSAFCSMFWGVISERRETGQLILAGLADALGIHKSVISKWFTGRSRPNWEINTIADLAHVLDLELDIKATDRNTGRVYTPSGVVRPGETSAGTLLQIVKLPTAAVPSASASPTGSVSRIGDGATPIFEVAA
jgi:Helix-turn-helix